MKRTLPFISVVIFSSPFLAGCTNTQTTPTTPAVAITTADLVSPAANVAIPYASQPIVLTVRNAAITGAATLTYTFEVATDAAFGTITATKTVAEGANGQTSATLDTLSTGDYYWRARASSGTTVGPISSSSKFTVGANITIAAPTVVTPADGSKASRQPTLTVKNATRTGAAGAITYKFEISTSATFGTVLITSTQPEGTTNTSFILTSNLTPDTKYYWRVTAIDAANNVSSTATVLNFTTRTTADSIATQQGVTLWPGQVPTGAAGQSALSSGWYIANLVSYDGQPYLNPPIEALRLFELMDRGMTPQGAIDWLRDHGYESTGQWYPSVAVIGIPHVYLALIDGEWELVHRAGG